MQLEFTKEEIQWIRLALQEYIDNAEDVDLTMAENVLEKLEEEYYLEETKCKKEN